MLSLLRHVVVLLLVGSLLPAFSSQAGAQPAEFPVDSTLVNRCGPYRDGAFGYGLVDNASEIFTPLLPDGEEAECFEHIERISPDRLLVALRTGTLQNPSVMIADAGNTTVGTVTNCADPRFSPDSARLVCRRGGNILEFTTPPPGSPGGELVPIRTITSTPATPNRLIGYAADGSLIVTAVTTASPCTVSTVRLHRVDLDTSQITAVPHNDGCAKAVLNAAISDDGTLLGIVEGRGWPYSLSTLPAIGGVPSPIDAPAPYIHRNDSVTFTPDGGTIMYRWTTNIEDVHNVGAVDLTTGAFRVIDYHDARGIHSYAPGNLPPIPVRTSEIPWELLPVAVGDCETGGTVVLLDTLTQTSSPTGVSAPCGFDDGTVNPQRTHYALGSGSATSIIAADGTIVGTIEDCVGPDWNRGGTLLSCQSASASETIHLIDPMPALDSEVPVALTPVSTIQPPLFHMSQAPQWLSDRSLLIAAIPDASSEAKANCVDSSDTAYDANQLVVVDINQPSVLHELPQWSSCTDVRNVSVSSDGGMIATVRRDRSVTPPSFLASAWFRDEPGRFAIHGEESVDGLGFTGALSVGDGGNLVDDYPGGGYVASPSPVVVLNSPTGSTATQSLYKVTGYNDSPFEGLLEDGPDSRPVGFAMDGFIYDFVDGFDAPPPVEDPPGPDPTTIPADTVVISLDACPGAIGLYDTATGTQTASTVTPSCTADTIDLSESRNRIVSSIGYTTEIHDADGQLIATIPDCAEATVGIGAPLIGCHALNADGPPAWKIIDADDAFTRQLDGSETPGQPVLQPPPGTIRSIPLADVRGQVVPAYDTDGILSLGRTDEDPTCTGSDGTPFQPHGLYSVHYDDLVDVSAVVPPACTFDIVSWTVVIDPSDVVAMIVVDRTATPPTAALWIVTEAGAEPVVDLTGAEVAGAPDLSPDRSHVLYMVDGAIQAVDTVDQDVVTVVQAGPSGEAIVAFAAGNVADVAQPVVTGTPDRDPDNPPWYSAPVTITWDAPGYPTPPATVVEDDGADQVIESDPVCAGAGPCTTGTVVVSVDQTDPTITANLEPAANPAGWHNTPVGVEFLCADPTSGVASCTAPLTLTEETDGFTVTGSAADEAANSASLDVTVRIDLTAPDLVVDAPTEGSTVVADDYDAPTCTAADGLSGLNGSCSLTVTVTDGPQAGSEVHTVTATVSDVAGNTATHTRTYTVVNDVSAPEIQASFDEQANPAGWYAQPTTATFTCIDSSPVVDCPGPVTFTHGANQTVTVTASDIYGNVGTLVVAGINVDTVDPELEFTGAQDTYSLADTITIDCSASDSLSGIDTVDCPRVDTLAAAYGPGTHTLTATATDVAGNQTTRSHTFTVELLPDGLGDLVDLFLDDSAPGASGISNSLNAKIAEGNWDAFINQVEAKCCTDQGSSGNGKRFTRAQADTLIAMAEALRDS